MHQRSALQTREDRRIELPGQRLIVPQYQAAARPRSDLCVVVVVTCACGTGEALHAAGDEAGEMAPCPPTK